jgi:predicted metal-dependent peptidase
MKNKIQEFYQETVVNLISSTKYVDLSFYGFILAKCKVSYDEKFPTAGVSFENNNFHLTIGKKFLEWNLDERIAVLIHETRHILGLHMFRKGERDHELFNVATDIAINPIIDNLPEDALFPQNFDFPENKSAETYYEFLKEEKVKQEQEKQEAEESGEP